MDISIADLFAALGADFHAPMAGVPTATVIVRMLMACCLGGVIGIEREIHARTAGLRTHILVALASCLFTLIAWELIATELPQGVQHNTDPLRLIEAVTAGVAFLAAGSIITSRGRVQGLTTGAGMWMAGAIGLACGTGRLTLAILATLIAVSVLFLLRRISHSIGPKGDR